MLKDRDRVTVPDGRVHTGLALGPVSVLAGAMLARTLRCSAMSEKPAVRLHKLLRVRGALQRNSEAPLAPEAVWVFNEVSEHPCLAPIFSHINAARLLAGLVREDMGKFSFTTSCGCTCSLQPCMSSRNKVSSVVLQATVKPHYKELKTMYKFPAEGEFCHLYTTQSDGGSPSRLDPESS